MIYRSLVFWLLLPIYILFPNVTYGQFEDVDYAKSAAKRLQEGVLVVRLPVNAPKIRYFKAKLKEVEGEKQKIRLADDLQRTLSINQQKFEAIHEALKENYTFSRFLILPDSNYNAFVAGEKHVFINENGQVDPRITLEDKKYFLLISGENEDQWVLVNSDLKRLDNPFPHRATIFLSGITRVINCKKYYFKQMRWFQQKLSALI
ncbi:MAG: hypothetical protein WAT79_17075 [Saprospiraceae bacterium]